MATSFTGIKTKLDLPTWQATPLIYSSLHVAQTATAVSTLAYDKRASQYKRNNIYFLNAATTGSWTAAVPYDNAGLATFNTTAAHAYSVIDNKALVSPVSLANVPTNMYTFEPDSLSLKGYAPCPQVPSTVTDGDRLALDHYIDGTDKKTFFYWLPSSQSYMLRSLFYV